MVPFEPWAFSHWERRKEWHWRIFLDVKEDSESCVWFLRGWQNVSSPDELIIKTVLEEREDRGGLMLSRCSSKHTQGKIMSLECAASFVKSAPQFFHYIFSPAAGYIRLVIDGEWAWVKPVQGRENIVCGTLKSQSKVLLFSARCWSHKLHLSYSPCMATVFISVAQACFPSH